MAYTYKAKKGVMIFECDDCKKIFLTKQMVEMHEKYYCRVMIGKRVLKQQEGK